MSTDDVDVYVMTPEDFEAAKAEALASIDMTWDEVVACVNDCGCCVTAPEGVNEERLRQVWWVLS